MIADGMFSYEKECRPSRAQTPGYAGAWDVNLAKQLQKYYGEGGIWWNTKK